MRDLEPAKPPVGIGDVGTARIDAPALPRVEGHEEDLAVVVRVVLAVLLRLEVRVEEDLHGVAAPPGPVGLVDRPVVADLEGEIEVLAVEDRARLCREILVTGPVLPVLRVHVVDPADEMGLCPLPRGIGECAVDHRRRRDPRAGDDRLVGLGLVVLAERRKREENDPSKPSQEARHRVSAAAAMLASGGFWRNVATARGPTYDRDVAFVGRGLQILGLVLLPMGLFYGFDGGPNAMSLELGFLAAGAAAFLIGLKLQRTSGR